VLPSLAEGWLPLVAAMRVLRRLDLAVVLYTARQADVYVLTADRDRLTDLGQST
jgi:hypothetical protein